MEAALELGTVLLHVVDLEKGLEHAGLVRRPEVVSEVGQEVAHHHGAKLVEGRHRVDVVPRDLVLLRVEVRLGDRRVVDRLLAAPVLLNAVVPRRSLDLLHPRNLLHEGDVILLRPVHLRLRVEFFQQQLLFASSLTFELKISMKRKVLFVLQLVHRTSVRI